MITTVIIKVLISLVYGFVDVVLPVMPSFITQGFEFLFTYIIDAVDFIFLFVDKSYLSAAFTFWLAFRAVFLIIDIVRWLISLFHGVNAAESASNKLFD